MAALETNSFCPSSEWVQLGQQQGNFTPHASMPQACPEGTSYGGSMASLQSLPTRGFHRVQSLYLTHCLSLLNSVMLELTVPCCPYGAWNWGGLVKNP